MSLNKNCDPMGQAIADFHQNGKAENLMVNSSITEGEEIGVDYLFREFNEMPIVEQKALELCKGNILDIGAAAGCHSLYLQNKNCDVTAIDISELSVKTMLLKGVKNAECIDFYQYNKQKFDTLLFLMNGTGIAGDLKGLDHLLNKCKELLLPNGQILIDSSNIIYMFDDDTDYLNEIDGYYGELEYKMKYKQFESEIFKWLFIDYDLLHQKTSTAGYNCKLIIEGNHYDYLAQLTLK